MSTNLMQRALTVVTLALATTAQAEPFINLDFESVNTNAIIGYPFPMGGYYPQLSNVMPGWAINGRTNDGIALNGVCLGFCTTFISREAVQMYPFSTYFPNGMHGNYGIGVAPYLDFPISLSQRGDVPAGAKYLFLDAQYSTSASVALYIDGNHLTTYDISAYAGKTVALELRFFAFFQSPGPSMIPPTVGLDAVVFLVPPKLTTPSTIMGTNGFTLSWTNDVSTRYQVEFATNFPAKWQPIGLPVASTNGTFHFTDTTVTNRTLGQRFYRLRLAP